MGISGFMSWVVKHDGVFKKHSGNKCVYDHVYIDLNVILHRLSVSDWNFHNIIKQLCISVNKILKYNIPKLSLILFSDGIPPFAKLQLQKSRRSIDPLCKSMIFTTGTVFMAQLKNNLESYINKLKHKYNLAYIDVLTENIGEAEHKISMLIEQKYIPSKSFYVYSSDSDMILILASLNINNIYMDNGLGIINIKNLIISHLSCIDVQHDKHNYHYADFAFINLLCGNDYITKLNYVNIDKLWLAYKYTSRYFNYRKSVVYLCNDIYVIDMIFFKCFLVFLSDLVHNKYKKYEYWNINTYNPNKYNDYVFGLLWCINLYTNKINHNKDCYYTFNFSHKCIHPIELSMFVHGLGKICNYDNDFVKTMQRQNIRKIPNEIYAMLIIPQQSKHIINIKNHDIHDYNNDEQLTHIALCDKLCNIGVDICDTYVEPYKYDERAIYKPTYYFS